MIFPHLIMAIDPVTLGLTALAIGGGVAASKALTPKTSATPTPPTALPEAAPAAAPPAAAPAQPASAPASSPVGGSQNRGQSSFLSNAAVAPPQQNTGTKTLLGQ